MADHQKPPREEVSAPSHKVRAAYWFTILAVGSLSSALVNSNILSIFLFPFLLGRILFSPVHGCQTESENKACPTGTSDGVVLSPLLWGPVFTSFI